MIGEQQQAKIKTEKKKNSLRRQLEMYTSVLGMMCTQHIYPRLTAHCSRNGRESVSYKQLRTTVVATAIAATAPPSPPIRYVREQIDGRPMKFFGWIIINHKRTAVHTIL